MCQPGRPAPHGVERIALGGVDHDPLARAQIVERLAGQLAITGEAPHREIHVAIIGEIGVVILLQQFDQAQHLRNELRRARLLIGRQDAERGEVLLHRLDEARRERGHRFVVLRRTANDLVVDVGDVAHVGDAQPARAQPARDQIEGDKRARVAEMAIVVNGHAAHIHADHAGLDRSERLGRAGQCVVDEQGHLVLSVGARGPDRNSGLACCGCDHSRGSAQAPPAAARKYLRDRWPRARAGRRSKRRSGRPSRHTAKSCAACRRPLQSPTPIADFNRRL